MRSLKQMSTAALLMLGMLAMTNTICFAADPTTRPVKTVVCFGDSLTKTGYADTLSTLIPARIINAGKSGETSAAALVRFQKDVLDRKPDVVVLLYGTNDMVRDRPTPKVELDAYARNLAEMIRACQAGGARVIVCTVPPIRAEPYFERHPKANYDAAGGLAALVEAYGAAARRAAETAHADVVDLHRTLAQTDGWLSADGVHPSDLGRRAMAAAIAPVVQTALERERSPEHAE